MRKVVWAVAFMAVVVVASALGVWLLVPLVPGADIKASCHEPLTEVCMDRIRALGDELAAGGTLDEAVSWYSWAAGGGDKVAMFKLGGVNYVRAVDDAARRTHSDFVSNEEWRRAAVAEMTGFPAQTACGWFRRAADLGYPPAMNNVGECYMHGIGFTRSALAAVQWHRSAAMAGNPVAAMNLIRDIKSGLGGKADVAAADSWASKRFDQMNRSDLDEATLAYTLRAGVQISPEERDMMRQAGATMTNVSEAVAANATDSGGGLGCGFLTECDVLQGAAPANPTPPAQAPAQATQ
jgi:TPR repeat protein